MGLALMHRRRRLGAAFALFGMAFYALLLPWHTVSQATAALVGSERGIFAAPMCHSEAAAANPEPAKGKPAGPKTHCPICSGFAAFQLALAGTAIAVLVPPDTSAVLLDGTRDHLASITLRTPQSRGPPHTPS